MNLSRTEYVEKSSGTRPNQRQATQHGCLPGLLGDGDKGNEIVYGEEKLFCTGPTRAAKAERTLVLARQAQLTKEGPLSFVLLVPIHISFNSQ
jgi:hypothetical protein